MLLPAVMEEFCDSCKYFNRELFENREDCPCSCSKMTFCCASCFEKHYAHIKIVGGCEGFEEE